MDGIENEGDILRAGDDARQAHERARRIVGMDAHADPDLFRRRDHLVQEACEIFAQGCRVDAL